MSPEQVRGAAVDSPLGHLLVRRRPLRDADGAPRVHWRHRSGEHIRDSPRRPAAALGPGQRHARAWSCGAASRRPARALAVGRDVADQLRGLRESVGPPAAADHPVDQSAAATPGAAAAHARADDEVAPRRSRGPHRRRRRTVCLAPVAACGPRIAVVRQTYHRGHLCRQPVGAGRPRPRACHSPDDEPGPAGRAGSGQPGNGC